MLTYIKYYSDPDKLNHSQIVIRDKLYNRIVRNKQAKEMREKLKDLPYVCRNGFVKMYMLKNDTANLSQKKERLFSSMGRRK